MNYLPAEREQLKALSQRLMDGESLRHAERMIVDAVIQDCEQKGEDLSQRLQNFLAEGRAASH